MATEAFPETKKLARLCCRVEGDQTRVVFLISQKLEVKTTITKS
jgi:hypothetical protein